MLTQSRMRPVGIIGYPIGHSLSPLMQNAAFEAMGLEYCYLPLEVPPRQVGPAIRAVQRLGFCGFNVTIPHKQRVMRFLNELSPEARFIGAVNTVEIRAGRLIGHNTDGRGFVRAFAEEAGRSVRGSQVLILGAGGAARAVAFQIALEGAAMVVIANRSRSKAEALVRELRNTIRGCAATVLPWESAALRAGAHQAGIVINATSVGMNPTDPALLPAGVLRPDQVVCDLIYRPPMTALLRQARAVGAKAINGLGMLVYQGVLSFEIWTGQRPPVEVMRETLVQAVRRL